MTVSHTLDVDLGARSYPILVGRGLLEGSIDLSTWMRGRDCLVVTNDVVGPLYRERLDAWSYLDDGSDQGSGWTQPWDRSMPQPS